MLFSAEKNWKSWRLWKGTATDKNATLYHAHKQYQTLNMTHHVLWDSIVAKLSTTVGTYNCKDNAKQEMGLLLWEHLVHLLLLAIEPPATTELLWYHTHQPIF